MSFKLKKYLLSVLFVIGILSLMAQTYKSPRIYRAKINQPEPLNVDVPITRYNLLLSDTLLLGKDIIVSGGYGNYSFSWLDELRSIVSTKKLLRVSPLKNTKYYLCVADQSGCSEIKEINISVISPIKLESSQKNTTCFGGADGVIDLKITNGAPPYSIHWDNGDERLKIEHLKSGTYSVVVQDQMNQFVKQDFEILDAEQLFISLDTSICNNQILFIGDKEYTKTGIYSDTLVSKNNCDSIVQLSLEVNPTYNDTIDVTICQGQKYTVNDVEYNETGLYTQYLSSVSGCDSIVNLRLTINESYSDTIYSTICEGESYPWFDTLVFHAGFYSNVYTSVSGCDSIVHLYLTENEAYYDTLKVGICQGETFEWEGDKYEQGGIYQHRYSSINHCDSVVIFDLNIFDKPQEPVISLCGDTIKCVNAIGGQWFRDGNRLDGETGAFHLVQLPGVYYIVVVNENNCSSVSDSVSINFETAVNMNEKNDFCSVSPNPTHGFFSILFNAKKGKGKISVFAASGKTLFSKAVETINGLNRIPIRMDSYEKGLALLVLTFDAKTISRKIIFE